MMECQLRSVLVLGGGLVRSLQVGQQAKAKTYGGSLSNVVDSR